MASIPRRINNPFRGAKPTSAGSGAKATGGPVAAMGSAVYRGSPMWPGITEGNDARCSCSWAYHGGRKRMEVKMLSGARLVASHRRAS